MQKSDVWKIFNICLGLILLGLLVFIIMMVMGIHSAGNSSYEEAVNSSRQNLEKNDETKPTTNSTKKSSDLNNAETKSNTVVSNEKTDDEKDKKNVEDEVVEDKEKKVDEEDEKNDDKDDEDTDVKKLTGYLEKAQETDNEFEGNYKIIADGNTDYTYLWFSGAFKEYVDDLVGEKVEIEIKYNDDGTFEVISGPTAVSS